MKTILKKVSLALWSGALVLSLASSQADAYTGSCTYTQIGTCPIGSVGAVCDDPTWNYDAGGNYQLNISKYTRKGTTSDNYKHTYVAAVSGQTFVSTGGEVICDNGAWRQLVQPSNCWENHSVWGAPNCAGERSYSDSAGVAKPGFFTFAPYSACAGGCCTADYTAAGDPHMISGATGDDMFWITGGGKGFFEYSGSVNWLERVDAAGNANMMIPSHAGDYNTFLAKSPPNVTKVEKSCYPTTVSTCNTTPTPPPAPENRRCVGTGSYRDGDGILYQTGSQVSGSTYDYIGPSYWESYTYPCDEWYPMYDCSYDYNSCTGGGWSWDGLSWSYTAPTCTPVHVEATCGGWCTHNATITWPHYCLRWTLCSCGSEVPQSSDCP